MMQFVFTVLLALSLFTQFKFCLFIHKLQFINQAVIDNFMSMDSSSKKWHTYLADYYLTWSQDKFLKIEAIPYHCLQADLRQK